MHFDPQADTLPDAAHDAFAAWLQVTSRELPVLALHARDVDGLCAGLIWQHALQTGGFTAVQRLCPALGSTLFGPEVSAAAQAMAVGQVCLLSMHAARHSLDEALGAPVWHLHPEESMWLHPPNAASAAYELATALVPGIGLAWQAAVGAVAALGAHAPLPFLRRAKSQFTRKYLQAVVELVAAGLCHADDLGEAAARALLAHETPRAFMQSGGADVLALRGAAAEVNEALCRADDAQPLLRGRLAIIQVASSAHVEPLVARAWSDRLPQHIVLAVNVRPEEARYAARSASGLLVGDFLQTLPRVDGQLPVSPDGVGVVTRAVWESMQLGA